MIDKVEARDSSLTTEKILMTYAELSEATSICRRKLQTLVYEKGMPHLKVGRSVLFEKDAVARWLKKFRSRNVS